MKIKNQFIAAFIFLCICLFIEIHDGIYSCTIIEFMLLHRQENFILINTDNGDFEYLDFAFNNKNTYSILRHSSITNKLIYYDNNTLSIPMNNKNNKIYLCDTKNLKYYKAFGNNYINHNKDYTIKYENNCISITK